MISWINQALIIQFQPNRSEQEMKLQIINDLANAKTNLNFFVNCIQSKDFFF